MFSSVPTEMRPRRSDAVIEAIELSRSDRPILSVLKPELVSVPILPSRLPRSSPMPLVPGNSVPKMDSTSPAILICPVANS